MIDASAEERAAHLQRIAAAEIARHREAQGFLGAALEGSLATGAVWPTSDVDFTIVPRSEMPTERLLEWEQQQALPFLKEHADRRTHIDVCGQRDGVPWHKHLTDHRALEDLREGYPRSFVRPAEGPFNPGAHWFLDGLVVMQIVDDPEGWLAETQRFVAARRFAPEVWEGRRLGLLQELRRQRDLAGEALERGDADAAYQLLSGDPSFAAVVAQLWLEHAHQIVSSKEQDGHLAQVTAAAGCSEAHTLYRRTLAVEPERAEAAAPLLHQLSERAARLYRLLAALPPEDPGRRRAATVWGAHIAHLAGTLSLAPRRGHPAYAYRCLPLVLYWAIEYPARMIADWQEVDVSRRESLGRHASSAADLARQIQTLLLDPRHALNRARSCLAAADQLLTLTTARL